MTPSEHSKQPVTSSGSTPEGQGRPEGCTCQGDMRDGKVNRHSPHEHDRSCPLREDDIAGWDYPPPVDDLDAYTSRACRTGDWSWRR